MAKEKGATLIITEKPQAAEKIASALSDSKDEKITNKEKVSYYEFLLNGRKYYVGCAVGHLFEIQQKEKKGTFPNFDVEWKPSFNKEKGQFSKKYFDTLKKLCKEADDFIVATDFDVEGEVIGWNVVRFIAGKNDAKRMKFSSLTKDSIKESFNNVLPSINWGAAIAGESRHYIDWFYGINLSRALMKAISSSGRFRILSIGRVQGPALKIVVDREREIMNFKSEPFWQVFLQVKDIKGQKVEVKYPKDIFNESELLKFKHLKGKEGEAVTTINEQRIEAPIPFDLTTLQTECYNHFGLTPSQTLKIAQSLYLRGLISYPRTSSQKYPKSIGYEKILEGLKKYTSLVKYVERKDPTQGKKDDPAHPAIYPTGEIQKIENDSEKKVYDLIVKRFISCFCSDAIVEAKRIKVSVGNLDFYADGLKIKEKNWMLVYPSSVKEKEIPNVNGSVSIIEIRIEEKKTSPPKRYSPASLIKELEKRNLGTKSTRASIIETLYSRGYIKDKQIKATELGIRLVDTLEKYSPIILDEGLTRQMNEELEEMETSGQDLERKKEKVLSEAKEEIIKICQEMSKNLELMGKSLSDANNILINKEKEENMMSDCPVCKKGRLRILYGKKFSRYFVSCDNYPNCRNVYSLPPRGLMKPSRNKDGEIEFCSECGFPLVVSLQKGKSPWKFCFNPNCPTNEELRKKREEFKMMMASKNNGESVNEASNQEPKKKRKKKEKSV